MRRGRCAGSRYAYRGETAIFQHRQPFAPPPAADFPPQGTPLANPLRMYAIEISRTSRPSPLRHLRAFCVAARHRSFKIAADELCLTPSAVSHQMRELEEALGVRLFERKTRALDLTQAGASLLDDIAPLLKAIDRSVSQIALKSPAPWSIAAPLPANGKYSR